jgi:hypothetical protein
MRDYQQLASILDGLKQATDARLHYDLFADALVWSDELPAPEDRPTAGMIAHQLRGIWRYRTSLILGEPEQKFRAAWEEAQKCFPNWPGFEPTRRDVSLAVTFRELQQSAMKKWDELEERYEQQSQDRPQKASA